MVMPCTVECEVQQYVSHFSRCIGTPEHTQQQHVSHDSHCGSAVPILPEDSLSGCPKGNTRQKGAARVDNASKFEIGLPLES